MTKILDSSRRAEALSKTPALQKVSRWRIPNFDGDYKAAESVTFAKDHSASFFRAVRSALRQMTAKKE